MRKTSSTTWVVPVERENFKLKTNEYSEFTKYRNRVTKQKIFAFGLLPSLIKIKENLILIIY